MMVKMFIVDPPYMKRTEKVKVDAWGIALLTLGIGALQIVLDKGQREDWFQSDFILVFSAISALSLIAFVIVELFFAEHPIVDLRAFRNLSFSAGNVVMFVAFFNLLGSIVLLPLYAQILLGYTATLAGLLLSPGGVATLVTMPVVGKLIVKRNPKHILALGVLMCAFSTQRPSCGRGSTWGSGWGFCSSRLRPLPSLRSPSPRWGTPPPSTTCSGISGDRSAWRFPPPCSPAEPSTTRAASPNT
jgi:hypothetical protein